MKWEKLKAGFLAALLVVGFSACAKQPQPDANVTNMFAGTPDKDMVVLDITSEPVELNPLLIQDAISVDILRHNMAGLARLDENDLPVPDVAEKWEHSDDLTVTTVFLRKDAKWTNGDPVTAHDFYYSWVMQMMPETGTAFANFLYANIKNGESFYKGETDVAQLGVQVLDDYTLRIEWSRPMPSAAYYLAFPTYFPVNQKAYEQIGAEQYAKDADKMVSNGPYRISEWVHDDHILLEKSAEYFGADAIQVPKVKLVMIGDENTRLNAFMAGELDVTNLYSEQIGSVVSKSPDAIKTYIDGGSWYLDFNTKNAFLSNVNLRKALAYSVDVQALLDNVIKDGSVAADGLVPGAIAGAGGAPYAAARGSLFGYDPEKAKACFEQALQELGKNAGEIQLELMANDTTYSQTQAAYLQQQWKEKLGLDVGIRVLNWKARVEAKSGGDYDLIVAGWGPSENDAMTFLEVFVSDGDYNEGKFSNQEYDRLIAAAVIEGDVSKRQEFMIQAEKILMDEMAVGPLYFTCTTYAVSAKVEGLVRTPFQIFSFCNGARIVSA